MTARSWADAIRRFEQGQTIAEDAAEWRRRTLP